MEIVSAAIIAVDRRKIRFVEDNQPNLTIGVPGILSFQTSLGPYEKKEFTFQIPSNFDFLLHDVVLTTGPPSDGPIEITIKAVQAERDCLGQTDSSRFNELLLSLDQELPEIQAQFLGE